MTSLELAERVLADFGPLEAEQRNFIRYRVLSAVAEVLTRLAESVAAGGGQRRQLLQRDFTVPLTAGVGNLTPHLTGARPMLAGTISRVTHTSSPFPLQRHDSEGALSLPQTPMVLHYAVVTNTVKTRNRDGKLNTLGGSLTVTANFVPDLGEVPAQLEAELFALASEAAKQE
jgi:hypothetical protein